MRFFRPPFEWMAIVLFAIAVLMLAGVMLSPLYGGRGRFETKLAYN